MSKLFLHEAIAVILLSKKDRKATVEGIANEINRRKLYYQKNGNLVPEYQIMQRTRLGGGHYHYLFEWIEPNFVKLRNL